MDCIKPDLASEQQAVKRAVGCSSCKKRFSKEEDLDQHHIAVHADAEVFNSKDIVIQDGVIMQQTSPPPQRLAMILRSMSKAEAKAKAKSKPEPNPGRRRICTPCNQTFATRHAYKEHYRRAHVDIHHFKSTQDAEVENDERITHPHLGDPSTFSQHPVRRTYHGVPAYLIQRFLQIAFTYRYMNPQADAIIATTGISLDKAVVANLVDVVLRKYRTRQPPLEVRLLQNRQQQEAALDAESAFVSLVRKLHPDLVDQEQQTERIREGIKQGNRSVFQKTPDIRFPTPRMICGVLCSWIEYKSTFAYQPSGKSRTQLRGYFNALGQGIVVYRLGFKMGLGNTKGISYFCEAEVTDWLVSQLAGSGCCPA